MLWLLLLPFKLLFLVVASLIALPLAMVFVPIALVLWVPFMLLRLALKIVTAVVLLPLVLLMGLFGLVVGGIALVFAVFVPLLPFLFLAACVWGIWRLTAGSGGRTYPA